MADYIGKICPFCGKAIMEGEAVKVCPSCAVAHHDACWNTNRGCAVQGCSEQNTMTQYAEPSVLCKQCGTTYGEDQNTCPNCGTPNPFHQNQEPLVINENSATPVFVPNKGGQANVCSNCGAVLSPNHAFCPTCGQKTLTQNVSYQNTPVSPVAPAPPQKSKKKIMIPIIIGAAVLVIAIAVILFFVFKGPSVEQITLSQSAIEIKVDESATISYTITPQEATGIEVQWSTSDSNVASVSGSGVITGVDEGTCTVTATAGGKSGSVIVTVKKGPDFKKVHSKIEGDTYYCKLASDGSYLSIDTNPLDLDDFSSTTAWKMVKDANTELGLPSSVTTKMSETRAMDGRQSETYNGVKVSWTYHPDQGLQVLYEAE